MIVTLTTRTVAGDGYTMRWIAMVILLGLLVTKEFVRVAERPTLHALNRALDVALVPLTLGFATTILVQVVQALR